MLRTPNCSGQSARELAATSCRDPRDTGRGITSVDKLWDGQPGEQQPSHGYPEQGQRGRRGESRSEGLFTIPREAIAGAPGEKAAQAL